MNYPITGNVSLGNVSGNIKLYINDSGSSNLTGIGYNNNAMTFAVNQSVTATPEMVINPSGNVGIGTTNPLYTLDVNGSVRSSDVRIDNTTIHLGQNAGLTSQGTNSVAIGNNAGNDTQLLNSVAIGNGAGRYNQATQSVAIGFAAGQGTTGVGGNQKAHAIAIGASAGRDNQGENTIAIGNTAGRDNQATDAIAIGRSAGQNQGQGSIAIGVSTVGTGTNSVAIGTSATTSTGVNSIAIGNSADTAGFINSVALGGFTTCTASYQVRLGGVDVDTVVGRNLSLTGSNLTVFNNLLLQSDATTAYIRPLNAGSTLYLGTVSTNYLSISSVGLVTASAGLNTTALTTTTATTIAKRSNNQFFEFDVNTSLNNAFIDFHCNTNFVRDYDARIMASGATTDFDLTATIEIFAANTKISGILANSMSTLSYSANFNMPALSAFTQTFLLAPSGSATTTATTLTWSSAAIPPVGTILTFRKTTNLTSGSGSLTFSFPSGASFVPFNHVNGSSSVVALTAAQQSTAFLVGSTTALYQLWVI